MDLTTRSAAEGMYSAELFNSKKQFDKPANLINLSFLRI